MQPIQTAAQTYNNNVCGTTSDQHQCHELNGI